MKLFQKLCILFLVVMLTLFGICSSLASQEKNEAGLPEKTIIKSVEDTSDMASEVRAFRSSNIVGSVVQNPDGEKLGVIEDLIIDIENGQIIFAVLSCCGFLDIGSDLFAIPWGKLTPKPISGLFIFDISVEELEEAPGFPPDDWPAIGDNKWAAGIYDYYSYGPQAYPRIGNWNNIQKSSGGWGMATPYGQLFNPNTIKTIQSEVIRIDRFVPRRGMTEGIEIIINLKGEKVPVHFGPSWYLQYQDFDIKKGDVLTITGSHIEIGGLPVIIATKIESEEWTLRLRDRSGYPVWSSIPSEDVNLVKGENQITIQEFTFIPMAIQVSKGTTVTWINRDTAVHTVTSGIESSDKAGVLFDSQLQSGEKFSYTFNEPGEYPYFCRFHPNMTGRISVSEQ